MSRFSIALLMFVLFIPAYGKEKFSKPGPIRLDREGEKWAEKTLRKLTLEEKIGQLFMIWVRAEFLNVNSPEYLQLRDSMQKYHVGSFAMTVRFEPPFLYRNQPYEAAELLNRLQQDSKLPLLVAADFERGLSMRLYGGAVFPHAMAFGAAGKTGYAEAFGRITAEEARAIGVHWNFFPDADVNSNPANPIINTRSFGEDPQQVSDLVAAYIQGARDHGMLTTAKHFPGHGDTATDSHLDVAEVRGNRDRLQSVELPPFRKAIAAGVDAVMVAHVTVPALEPDPNRVATTSPAVVTDLLKNQLGFQGMIVTDALDMAGLTRLYSGKIGQAAVDAFKAGNDLLIIPPDLDASYNSMMEAVHSGQIAMAQIDASVLKILKVKASLGLHRARLVDVNQVNVSVGKPENTALGQQVSDDATTLVRDNGRLLPLKREGTANAALPYQTLEETRDDLITVIFSEDVRTDVGRTLERQIRTRVPDANVMYVDSHLAEPMSEEVLRAVSHGKAVVVAVYVVPTPGKALKGAKGVTNSVGLEDASGRLLEKILGHSAGKTVVLAMGNPYLAQEFPSVQNYLCSFSNSSVSEVSAVKALFGEIPIRGHLPVTIPDIAQRGTGIERQAAQTAAGELNHVDPKAGH
jgi:beta-N-acetylhexosaminidase